MFVKICGFKRKEDILQAVYEGVDAVGFIIGVTHKTEDALNINQAIELVKFIPSVVLSVMVTHFTNSFSVLSVAEALRPKAIQLQGDISVTDIVIIRDRIPEVKIIKAIHVVDANSINDAKHYEEYVDYILLDSKTKDRIGGTGKTHDWSISAQIVERIKKPVILAGGLNPENVADAIMQVKPFGVDVNSGTKGQDGFKDYQKIKQFIKNAKMSEIKEDKCKKVYL
ncbi:MAG: phosphoribosylanthranilate isomerase [Endomicrobia bacterium]|nr:phosphoribosylanthranilate isomerase [Endomicrobiia bacterium]